MKTNPVSSVCLVVALGCQVLLFSGCSSGYTRPIGQQPATAFKVSNQNPISGVTVAVAPEVQAKLKDSLKFDQQALARAVELALSNRQLLNAQKKEGAVVMQITVTHVRVRNTFSAVMWGAMSGNDSIKGDVVVKDANGGVVDQFHVDTAYALGGYAGGQDSMRMNWLYEAFAKQVVRALTGEDKKD